MAERTRDNPSRRSGSRRAGFWIGVAVFLGLLLFANLAPGDPAVTRMAAVAALMAIWWITDAIPLAATALVPVVAFPALGLQSGKEVAGEYVNWVIFLFVGGFLIALAMQRWNLHRRIAFTIIRRVGGNPARMVLGFMVATAFLSMWISNTATTIMMLAIGIAVLSAAESSFGKRATANLGVALLLGIAYSASIGGMATLVGTPPNVALARIFDQTFPGAEAAGATLAFGQWMLLGVPLAVVLLVVAWFLLVRVFYRSPPDLQPSRELLEAEHAKLGPMRHEEKAVLAVFTLTALLWMFRKDLAFGEAFTVPGWSRLLPTGKLIDDGTVAIAMALLLFLIPARRHPPADPEGEGGRYGALLDFGVFAKVPWHIVLLFGGGFALASGFKSSGLSEWVAGGFGGMEGTSPVVLVAGLCTVLTFLTELTSNTATTEMVLPLLASIGIAIDANPLLLMIPATLSASCAFMMPVATPPNAIVFGSGRVRVWQMVKVGFVLNLAAIVLVTALFLLLGPPVFGIEEGVRPDWAR